MEKMTLYESDYAVMWYHPDTKIVHHKVKKFIYGEEFHKFILSGTEAMKKYHAQKWLSDDSANTILRKEESDWGRDNWFPQTVAAGWKYWAIIQPEAVIAKMNMEQLAKEYAAAGVTARFFTDVDEGMKWLESM